MGYDVIVDAGRMGPHGLPGPLVERSAVTGLVLRTSLRAVLSARVHLPSLTEQERLSTAGRTGLVLVGEGEPYGRREVAQALGVGVHAVVAHDPAVAAHLSDGEPRPAAVRRLAAGPEPARGGGRPRRPDGPGERGGGPVSVDETAAPRVAEDAAPRVRALADVPLLVESVEVEGGASPVTRQALQSYGAFRRDDLRAAALPLPTAELDWPQVVQLRRQASEEIAGESEHQLRTTGTPITGDDRLLLGRSVIRRVVADHVRTLHREGAALWSPDQEQAYVAAVEAAVFGYGRLQPLLALPDVENIEIHGWDSVVVQLGDGRRQVMPPVADSDAELVEAIRFLGQNAEPSRPFDDVHPTMTLALGERFRLHAIGFGLSYRPERGDPPAHDDVGLAGSTWSTAG